MTRGTIDGTYFRGMGTSRARTRFAIEDLDDRSPPDTTIHARPSDIALQTPRSRWY
jgi:hypothetical protein